MANTLSELLIKLGYNTSGLDKGAKEIVNKSKKISQEMGKIDDGIAANAAKAGEKAGKNFVQNYNKQLTFLGQALRFAGLNKTAEALDLGRQYQETKLANKTPSRGSGASLPMRGAGSVLGSLGKGGSFAVGLAGGTAAAAAATVAVAGLTLAVGHLGNKIREADIKKMVDAKTVDEIRAIIDPIQRTQRIIEEFGPNGQKVFRDMAKSADDFRESLEKNSGLRRMGDNLGMLTNIAVDGFKKLGGIVLSGLNKWATAVTNFWEWMGAGMSKDLSKDLREGAANVIKMQEKLDKKRAKQAKDRQEEAKLADTIAQKEFDAIKDNETKLSILERQKGMLQEIFDTERDGSVQQLRAKNALLDINKQIEGVQQSITAEGEKQQKVDEQLARAKEAYNQAVSDANTSYEERSKFSLSELANSRAVNAVSQQNIWKANQVQNAERWAKQFRLVGNERGARNATEFALKMRESLGVLKESDRVPMKTVLEKMDKSLDEFNRLANTVGIKTRVTMGR